MRRAIYVLGPKHLAVVLIAAVIAYPLCTAAQDTCALCHAELGGELASPTMEVPESVHGDVQLSCAGCHGGDPEAEEMEVAMSPANGYVGIPAREDVPAFCGKCHSDERYMRQYRPRIPVDQERSYWTSQHGMRLKEGDEKVAECVSCHGYHSVKRARNTLSKVYPTNVPETCGKCHNDPDYMADYDIPVDQLDQYERSVHGMALLERGDTGAPACNDCHSNHGAVPPGVTSVANICGNCHPSTRELFVSSPHKEAFDVMGYSECIICHGNHLVERPSDAMLGAGDNAVCVQCHEEGDAGYNAATDMKENIVSLDQRLEETSELIARASEAGMEMSEEEFALREVRSRVVMARNLVHSLDPDTVAAVVEEGNGELARVSLAGSDAFEEIAVRRKGLALSSTVIVLLIAGLFLTLRNIERRQGRRK